MPNIEELELKKRELEERKKQLLRQIAAKNALKAKELEEKMTKDSSIEVPEWVEWYKNSGFESRIEGRDVDFTMKVPKLLGEGTLFKRENSVKRAYVDLENNGKREVVADITTYRGICIEAVHYYCRMKVTGVYWRNLDETGNSSMYAGFTKFPKYCDSIEVEITKKLTVEEIERDPARWEYYDEGDSVIAFEDLDELRQKIESEFERIFGSEDWILIINE